MDILSALYGADMKAELASADKTLVAITLRKSGKPAGELSVTLTDSDGLLRLEAATVEVRSFDGPRSGDANLRIRLASEAKKLIAEDCDAAASVSALVDLAQELLQLGNELLVEAPSLITASTIHSRHCLLLIDHMRSRRSYTRQISDWAAELSLSGALLHGGEAAPLILLYLRGSPDRLREYKRLHRTTPVDVDSTGRKCREKMMSELYDGDVTDDHGDDHHDEPDPAASRIDKRCLASREDHSDGLIVADAWPPRRVVAYLLGRGIPPAVLSDIPLLRDAVAAATKPRSKGAAAAVPAAASAASTSGVAASGGAGASGASGSGNRRGRL